MREPLEDGEIKLVARMDDEFPEINFTDGPNRVQVRCKALGGGAQGRANGHTG